MGVQREYQALLLACMLALVVAGEARAQWKVSGPDEKSFIKLGFLAQGRAEWEDTADTHGVNANLFLRRFRILAGGNITERLSFFFDTDTLNLGKYEWDADAGEGRKVEADMFIQDFYACYSFGDEFKIDGGLILIPASHNSEQSAATMLAVYYGPYSFLASGPTESRMGRDYGVQARGYLFDQHLEYRLGVFQGDRDLGEQDQTANAPFRYAGRIVFYLFEAETGFYYSGTTLGKKKILAIGASADLQDEYRSYAGDLYWDQPLPSGDAITLQVDYMYYDGDTTFGTLAAQNDWLIEAGYYNGKTRLGGYTQVAIQDFVQSPRQNEARYQAGLIYWGKGHNFNLKAAYAVIFRNHTETVSHNYRDLYVLQCQVFMF